MKKNPLFVDSTKITGDFVVTTFELTHVITFDSEEMFLRVQEKNGPFHEKKLTLNEQNIFEASLHLTHQSSITYQFLIKKDGEIVYKTEQFKDSASYVLETRWEPCLDVEILTKKSNIFIDTNSEENHSTLAMPKETFNNLIKKWGL